MIKYKIVKQQKWKKLRYITENYIKKNYSIFKTTSNNYFNMF